MIERFDHLVIAARDLDVGIQRYRDALGFDIRVGGRHPGRGTRNALMRFGLDYMELIAIDDETEAKGSGRGSLADFLHRFEGGLVAYALATDDIEAEAARFSAAGLAIEGPFAMQRIRPDGTTLSWRLLVPGGDAYRQPWPFFIQWDQSDQERLAGEGAGQHPNGTRAVRELAVAVRDIEAGVDLYLRQLGLPLAERGSFPELAAESALFVIRDFRIALLAPTEAGPLQDFLAVMGEGVFHSVLDVSDLEEARRWLDEHGTSLAPAPGVPGGMLIDPERGLGARLVLRQRSTS